MNKPVNTARKIANAKYAGEGVTLSPDDVARLHALIQAVGGHLTGDISIHWVRNVQAVVEGEATPGDNIEQPPNGEEDEDMPGWRFDRQSGSLYQLQVVDDFARTAYVHVGKFPRAKTLEAAVARFRDGEG